MAGAGITDSRIVGQAWGVALGVGQALVRGELVLLAQGWNVVEIRERFRVGKSVGIVHWLTMNDVAYCQFDNFAGDGSWNVGDLNDFCWHMSRRGIRTDDCSDLLF